MIASLFTAMLWLNVAFATICKIGLSYRLPFVLSCRDDRSLFTSLRTFRVASDSIHPHGASP